MPADADPPEVRARMRRMEIERFLDVADDMESYAGSVAKQGKPIEVVNARLIAIDNRLRALMLHVGLRREEDDERSPE